MCLQVRACSHGGGGRRVGEVPRLGRVTNLSIQSLLSFFLDCVHLRGGVPNRGELPCQPGRVTRLGGVSFLHVNAEGGVPRLFWVMFFWAFIFSLKLWKPHPSYPGLLRLDVKARFFLLLEGGVSQLPGFPTSM